jgi:hypothetical protein
VWDLEYLYDPFGGKYIVLLGDILLAAAGAIMVAVAAVRSLRDDQRHKKRQPD